jgi:hypothetical protein
MRKEVIDKHSMTAKDVWYCVKDEEAFTTVGTLQIGPN